MYLLCTKLSDLEKRFRPMKWSWLLRIGFFLFFFLLYAHSCRERENMISLPNLNSELALDFAYNRNLNVVWHTLHDFWFALRAFHDVSYVLHKKL